MKKLMYSLLLCALLLTAALVPAMAEGTDAVSSASVADFYGATALTGDELMDAINSTSGFYLVSTTNPDGTPNSAYFIFAMRKNEDKYYLQLGLADNQTKANLAANGVDLTYAIEAPAGMGMWLAVMDENGDLAGSISRQPDSSRLDALFQERGDEIMQNCDDVVLEIDMRASIADRVFELAEKHQRDIYVIVGNMGVILKRQALLSRARLIVMNEIEAGLLFGCTLDPADPERVLEVTRIEANKRDLKQIVVTLGVHGSIYFDSRNGDAGFVPAEPTRLVDSTGAGDAFFSGTVAARIQGLPLSRAAQLGAHLAALTIRTEESTCPRIESFLDESL